MFSLPWVWVKIKPPNKPQAFIYQDSPFWGYPIPVDQPKKDAHSFFAWESTGHLSNFWPPARFLLERAAPLRPHLFGAEALQPEPGAGAAPAKPAESKVGAKGQKKIDSVGLGVGLGWVSGWGWTQGWCRVGVALDVGLDVGWL